MSCDRYCEQCSCCMDCNGCSDDECLCMPYIEGKKPVSKKRKVTKVEEVPVVFDATTMKPTGRRGFYVHFDDGYQQFVYADDVEAAAQSQTLERG